MEIFCFSTFSSYFLLCLLFDLLVYFWVVFLLPFISYLFLVLYFYLLVSFFYFLCLYTSCFFFFLFVISAYCNLFSGSVCVFEEWWWIILDSNERPLACRASALTNWANDPRNRYYVFIFLSPVFIGYCSLLFEPYISGTRDRDRTCDLQLRRLLLFHWATRASQEKKRQKNSIQQIENNNRKYVERMSYESNETKPIYDNFSSKSWHVSTLPREATKYHRRGGA